MFKTLRISIVLKNTYRVNTILFSLKSTPILGKILPISLYKSKGLKILATILALIWELGALFVGKFLYFVIFILSVLNLLVHDNLIVNQVFLHILLCLSLVGSLINTDMFENSKDRYYAIVNLRMDAKQYTLVNYFYDLTKTFLGFLVMLCIIGIGKGLSPIICVLISFCIIALKIFMSGKFLSKYERQQNIVTNKISKQEWLCSGVLLILAYGLPFMGYALPFKVSVGIFLIFIPLGGWGLLKILTFKDYRIINQQLLAQLLTQMDDIKKEIQKNVQQQITTDNTIGSNKKGFEYLNELFIKRHRKILWDSAKRISIICLIVLSLVLVLMLVKTDLKPAFNKLVLTRLPYFTLIMYFLNCGKSFTQALFMNCDHSLLTYSFYKQPRSVLKLFQIRLREIIKINLMPSSLIALGLVVILFVSGGTANLVNYVILVIAILCMSIFFSIHYLVIYYLLQPYDAATEIKSATYKIISGGTYFLSYLLSKIQIKLFSFGIIMIIFCICYLILASFLVYKFAPKTFKLR